jgi:hypothetical protein
MCDVCRRRRRCLVTLGAEHNPAHADTICTTQDDAHSCGTAVQEASHELLQEALSHSSRGVAGMGLVAARGGGGAASRIAVSTGPRPALLRGLHRRW